MPPPPTVNVDWPNQHQATAVSSTTITGTGLASSPLVSPPTFGVSLKSIGTPNKPIIPTFFDRLETYRQFAYTKPGPLPSAGLLSTFATNTIVSQTPLHAGSSGSAYTTSLVERTQDLRNWLKQAKTEHELLSTAPPQTDL